MMLSFRNDAALYCSFLAVVAGSFLATIVAGLLPKCSMKRSYVKAHFEDDIDVVSFATLSLDAGQHRDGIVR